MNCKFRCGHLIRVVLALFASSHTVQADSIPLTAFSGRQFYYSISMETVSVNFIWPDSKLPESEIRDTVDLPRAYIMSAVGYASRPSRYLGKYFAERKKHGYEKLPATIETDSISVLATYPDGEPYTISLKSRASRKQWPNKALKNIYIARIVYISETHPLPHSIHTVDYEGDTTLAEYDGLLFNPQRSNPRYYNNPSDAFFYAYCTEKIEKALPVHLCQYAVPLGPHYLAMVDFLDFRLHGGRAFANERIAAFQKAMCRYFPC